MIFLIVFFVLITNKRRVKILEILWNFRETSVISENVENIKQVQVLTFIPAFTTNAMTSLWIPMDSLSLISHG